MSKAADKVRSMLAVQLGPNVPTGASRQFVNLVKSIGEAGSNHVSFFFLLRTTPPPPPLAHTPCHRMAFIGAWSWQCPALCHLLWQ